MAPMIGVHPTRDPDAAPGGDDGLGVLTATVQSWGDAGGSDDLLAMLDDGFAALRRVTVDPSG